MKNTERKMLVPLMFRVSARAMANAATLMQIVDTTVKRAVNQKEWRKSASVSA